MRGRPAWLALGALAALALAAAVVALALSAHPDTAPPPFAATPPRAATPPATATVTPLAANAPGTVTLRAVSGVGSGEVVLQWTSTAASIASWEFRRSKPICWEGWEAWQAIPSSGPATASHRVSGLKQNWAYCFEVRARTSGNATVTSNEAVGHTLEIGADGIARMRSGVVVEGGHAYRIGGTDFVIDVPDEMLLKNVGVALNHGPNELTVHLLDVASGSYFFMNAHTGKWLSRVIIPASQPTGQARDVNALFDQIEASTRKVPYSP